MNTESENDIALVERYFDLELSDQEMTHFNDRLENDSNFKALFDREKMLIQSIRYEGLRNDLGVLKEIEKRASENSTPKSLRLDAWYFKVAAVVIIIIIAGRVLIPTEEDSGELFQAYFKPYPNFIEPTMRGANDATQRSEIFLAYDQHNYQKALDGFNEILKNENEPAVLLLAGNANLALGNVEEAKNNFRVLIKDFDEYDTQAKWYLSLCYLKEGDIDQAKMMWEELKGAEMFYVDKAKQLLKKVD